MQTVPKMQKVKEICHKYFKKKTLYANRPKYSPKQQKKTINNSKTPQSIWSETLFMAFWAHVLFLFINLFVESKLRFFFSARFFLFAVKPEKKFSLRSKTFNFSYFFARFFRSRWNLSSCRVGIIDPGRFDMDIDFSNG